MLVTHRSNFPTQVHEPLLVLCFQMLAEIARAEPQGLSHPGCLLARHEAVITDPCSHKLSHKKVPILLMNGRNEEGETEAWVSEGSCSAADSKGIAE